MLEKSENVHDLHDKRFGLFERCVTYEGPEYYYNSAPLRGPVLAGQIQKICESLVTHISEVTFSQLQVSRMVINFKVDSQDKIWLLYTTSIRCISALDSTTLLGSTNSILERNLINIDNVLKLPKYVTLNPNKSFENIGPKKRVYCLSCGIKVFEDLRYPITYKTLVKHHEYVIQVAKSHAIVNNLPDVIQWPIAKDVLNATGNVGFACIDLLKDENNLNHIRAKILPIDYEIPPIIKTIHPKLNNNSFIKCYNV